MRAPSETKIVVCPKSAETPEPMPGGDASSRPYQPPCDSWDTDRHRVFSIELPGMLASDISVEVAGDQLRVFGRRSDQGFEPGSTLNVLECHHGTFERQLPFPAGVDPKEVSARYYNGILELVLPKPSPVERVSRIEVQAEPHRETRPEKPSAVTANAEDEDEEFDCDCCLG